MRTLVIALAISMLVATMAVAGDCGPAAGCDDPGCCDKAAKDKSCCSRCGSMGKTCQVESGVRLVKRHVWVVECSDMCPSLPGRGCCKGCGKGADCGAAKCEAGCEAGCAAGKDPCESLKNRKYVEPKCMKSRTIKKLVRKEILCEVPAYKCVSACAKCGKGCGEPAAACGCGEGGGAEEATPAGGAPEEAPPAPDAPATETAPEPPVVGTAYLEALKLDR
ncbi:MAG: hypothetical protein HQ567_26970 [Candidatus Nealsonbacteria bacterium]|nr:hypothetical protein [Candidatus Nealsonbacteria bacterium]